MATDLSAPMECPSCHKPMARGQVTGYSRFRAATIAWIPAVLEKGLTNMVAATFKDIGLGAPPRFPAFLCEGCRVVFFRY